MFLHELKNLKSDISKSMSDCQEIMEILEDFKIFLEDLLTKQDRKAEVLEKLNSSVSAAICTYEEIERNTGE